MTLDAILTGVLALLGVVLFVKLLRETRTVAKTTCDDGCQSCEHKRTKG